MDDRFDRRELLLHLGDMLDAAHRLTAAGNAVAPVARIARDDASLRPLAFLQTLAPAVLAADFAARTAEAFATWPKALLAEKLDHDALASTVQRALFNGNPDGWRAYVDHMQHHVKWFGANLADTAAEVTGATATAAPQTMRETGKEKKGWPWPERD